MSSLLHGLGLLLLPLCGWLAGDAVQARTTLHLTALQHTIELLQRRMLRHLVVLAGRETPGCIREVCAV